MSRHRAVRDLAKSRDYEDEMEDEEEDDFGTSPASPSGKPAAKGSGLGAFLSPAGGAKPVPRTSGFEVAKPSAPSSTYAASNPPPGFSRPATTPSTPISAPSSADNGLSVAERLAQCLSAIHAVLGHAHSFSSENLAEAARKANFDSNVAISRLLDGTHAAPPKAVPISGNLDSAPSSVPSSSSDSTSVSFVAPEHAPASRSAITGAFVRPAFGAKRAAHPSAKMAPSTGGIASSASVVTTAPAPATSVSTSAPAVPVAQPPPLAAPPPSSSPQNWPANFPSLFGHLLCAEVDAATIPASLMSSFSWSAWQAGGAARYAFDEPSPDDVVFDKRKAAFQQLKQPQERKAAEPVIIKTPVRLEAPTPKAPTTPAASLTPAPAGSEEHEEPMSPARIPSPQPAKARKLPKQHSAARRKELESKLAETKEEKVRLNLVVIGHVDAGKSTLMGHMLYALGGVEQKTMNKFERDSQKEGKGSFKFAWVLDAHSEERARGITMDVAVEHFETPHRYVTLLDAPGHRDFVPNMISGAAQADVAILVVNARTGEFEAGFEANGQTREHAVLARSLGVQQLIVAVNQLDAVGWSKERFDGIVVRLAPFLKQAGYKDTNVWFVPVSGYTGENLTKRTVPELSAWYNGPTLLERIDTFAPPARLVQRPFRMCVSDVYKGLNMGVVAVGGKIEAGLVSLNDNLLVLPACELCTVKTVLSNHEAVQVASAGNNVELGLQGLDPAILSTGSVLCDPEFPIPVAKKFTAQIITFSPLAHPITQGMHIIVHVQNVNEAGFLSKLVAITDRNTATVVKKRPKMLPEKTNAIVEITLHRPLCLELYSSYAQLGRFMIRDSGKTIAAGIVTELNEQVKI